MTIRTIALLSILLGIVMASDSLNYTPRSAVVIGAGPSGLATTLGLCQVCDKVYLVEKKQEFTAQGATYGLAGNGLKALEELSPGISKEMEKVGIPMNHNGGLMMPWWDMRDVLLQRVRQAKNVEIITGQVFTDISDDNDESTPVSVTLTNGRVLKGDFVVGADGVHSSVREWLNLPPCKPTETTVFRGHVQRPIEEYSPRLQALLTKGVAPIYKSVDGVFFAIFNFHSIDAGKMAWVVSTAKDIPIDGSVTPMSLAQEALGNDDQDLELLREVYSLSDPEQLIPYRKTGLVDFSDQFLAPLNGRWGGRGRVTLVGDAAHAMRPVDGQGGSQAFEDAVILYRILLKNSESVADDLRELEVTRLPRVKKLHDNQRRRFEQRMAGETAEEWSSEFAAWVAAGV